jgi:small subunit ribosomal protein S16
MLRIRLQRVGRRHEPVFRVVLTESQNSTKSGRVKEILGSYDPRFNKSTVNGERVKYWISVGAQPTDTMHNLLITNKVISGKKVNVLPRKSPIKKEEAVVADTPKVETKEEATPKAEVAEVVEEAKAEESPKAE